MGYSSQAWRKTAANKKIYTFQVYSNRILKFARFYENRLMFIALSTWTSRNYFWKRCELYKEYCDQHESLFHSFNARLTGRCYGEIIGWNHSTSCLWNCGLLQFHAPRQISNRKERKYKLNHLTLYLKNKCFNQSYLDDFLSLRAWPFFSGRGGGSSVLQRKVKDKHPALRLKWVNRKGRLKHGVCYPTEANTKEQLLSDICAKYLSCLC